MTDASEFLSKVLIATARNVADCLAFFGLKSEESAFAVLIWPVGKPERVSSIAGSGDVNTQYELAAACLAASEKAKGQPAQVVTHTSEEPAGHA